MAQLQDEEVGDGTTSVVIVAAELLKNADELAKQKIHPTSTMVGTAEQYLSKNIKDAVLTVPAFFNDSQRPFLVSTFSESVVSVYFETI